MNIDYLIVIWIKNVKMIKNENIETIKQFDFTNLMNVFDLINELY